MGKAKTSAKRKPSIIEQNVIFIWIAIATAALLLVPLLAGQFDASVHWTAMDFVTMAVLVYGLSSGFVLVARRVHSDRRLLVGLAFTVLFLYIWAELSVGVFTK